jgi:hypothetical protein
MSIVTMRRITKGMTESLSRATDVSGVVDETYQLKQPDTPSVTIQGDTVVVDEGADTRLYQFGKGGEGRSIARSERIRTTPSGGILEGGIDEASLQRDLDLIAYAFKMYEQAKASPDGFEPSSPYEGSE